MQRSERLLGSIKRDSSADYSLFSFASVSTKECGHTYGMRGAGAQGTDAGPRQDAVPTEEATSQHEPPRRGLRRRVLAAPTPAAAAVVEADGGEGVTTRRGVKLKRAEGSDDGDDTTVALEASTKVEKVGRLLPDVPVCYDTIRAREAVRRQAMVCAPPCMLPVLPLCLNLWLCMHASTALQASPAADRGCLFCVACLLVRDGR